MSNAVKYGFQEDCSFSAQRGSIIVGIILSHLVAGEFKWKAIGNGDRVFEGDLMKRVPVHGQKISLSLRFDTLP